MIEKQFQTSMRVAESSAFVAHASNQSHSRWQSKQHRVKQVGRRSQSNTTEKTAAVFSGGKLAV